MYPFTKDKQNFKHKLSTIQTNSKGRKNKIS